MRTATRSFLASSLLLALATASCESEADPGSEQGMSVQALRVGETREVELRYMRFDVKGVEQVNNLEQLRALPRAVLEDIWLVDLEVGPLLENALERLLVMRREEVEALAPADRNMHRILTATPDNVDLAGTSFEELIALSAAVSIPPARTLANLFQVGVTDTFKPVSAIKEVLVANVIATHPNAQVRLGPITAEHPDGTYPITPGTIPITLADVVSNFENLAERFGPVDDHPGFLVAAKGFSVIEEDFRMIAKVNANALPWKGIDLSHAAVASVSNIGAQIETLFDFSDPDWLRIEGLVPNPTVEELTVIVQEHDEWIPSGTQREPLGQGNSPAWGLDPWDFEHLVVEMSRQSFATIEPHCDDYKLGTGVVVFRACIDEHGWVELETFNNAGSPPPPAYIWDLDLEMAQVLLHRDGLEEGAADAKVTVRDIEVGITPDELMTQARANIEANPHILKEFAKLLVDSTEGDADIFYVRADDEDYLMFVEPEDIALDTEGAPVRPYAYEAVGFFADAGLTKKVSDKREVDGDSVHEKVRITPGDVFYVADDIGQVYRVDVGAKSKRSWVSIAVTRVR